MYSFRSVCGRFSVVCRECVFVCVVYFVWQSNLRARTFLVSFRLANAGPPSSAAPERTHTHLSQNMTAASCARCSTRAVATQPSSAWNPSPAIAAANSLSFAREHADNLIAPDRECASACDLIYLDVYDGCQWCCGAKSDRKSERN